MVLEWSGQLKGMALKKHTIIVNLLRRNDWNRDDRLSIN